MTQDMRRVLPAFLEGRDARHRNLESRDNVLYLHGNRIAWLRTDGIVVTLAGWPSPVTRRKLNGLPGVSVHQRNHEQYLNQRPWDGSPALVRPNREWTPLRDLHET